MTVTVDDLYPASFRGAPFLVESASTRGGRKTVVHEFPNSDRRFIEDLGLFNEDITIEATVPTADYFSVKNGLKLALDMPGYGTLIHPFYGIRNVAVIDYTIQENIRELGYVKFNIHFMVGQELPFPGAQDVDSLIQGQVQALYSVLQLYFVDTYTFNNRHRTNFKAYQALIQNYISTVDLAVTTYFNRSEYQVDAVADFNNKFTNYQQNYNSYIQTPSALYTNTQDVINALTLTATSNDLFIIASKLSNFSLGQQLIEPRTSAQQEKNDNLLTIYETFAVLNFGLLCNAIVVYDVKSLDDVNLLRRKLDREYEKILDSVRLSTDVLQDIQDLRASVINYLDQQRLVAPEVITIDVDAVPLSVLEYSLYGNNYKTDDLRILNFPNNIDPTYLRYATKIYSK